jgi:hypothetical protein
VPSPDQLTAVTDRRLGRLLKVLRRIAIHQCLSDDRADTASFRLLKKDIGGFRMDCRKDQCRCGSAARQLLEELLGDGARMTGVMKLRFGGKCVAVQPLQQISTIGTDHFELRGVEVSIDEPGGDQATSSEVDELVVRGTLD